MQDQDLEKLFIRLSNSRFRSSFKLNESEMGYLKERGLGKITLHAFEFIERRLKPANPVNDGKQTPFGKHPVFVAQHATATCCRGCLEKWHGIEKGRTLDRNEVEYIVSVIRKWIENEVTG